MEFAENTRQRSTELARSEGAEREGSKQEEGVQEVMEQAEAKLGQRAGEGSTMGMEDSDLWLIEEEREVEGGNLSKTGDSTVPIATDPPPSSITCLTPSWNSSHAPKQRDTSTTKNSYTRKTASLERKGGTDQPLGKGRQETVEGMQTEVDRTASQHKGRSRGFQRSPR